jgi:hypothetical protein
MARRVVPGTLWLLMAVSSLIALLEVAGSQLEVTPLRHHLGDVRRNADAFRQEELDGIGAAAVLNQGTYAVRQVGTGGAFGANVVDGLVRRDLREGHARRRGLEYQVGA